MTRTYSAPHPFLNNSLRHKLTFTAIDVVKTRIQIDPALKGHSLLSGGRKIVAVEGPKGLITGAGPTFVGYA